MRPGIIFCCVFFLCLSVNPRLQAQSRSNFFTIGVEQGLSNTNVWSINQDKYGYIWIATEGGLNRYDGHTMKQYFHSETDKTSVAGNACYWIFKDSDGDMWFACGGNGLSRYNYINDNFESLAAYDSVRKNNRYNAPVWRFGEDAQKRIYLSCGAACYRYNKSSKKFEDLTPLFGPGFDAGIGRFFLQDSKTMWIAADDGLYHFDIPANRMRKIPFDIQKQGFGEPGMRDIEWVNDHEVMISMEKAGYVIFDIYTEKFRPADDPFYPGRSGRFSEMGDLLLDSKKRLWMANTYSGLVKYNPGNGRSEFIKKDPLYPYPYPDQEGQGKAIFEDRDGNIWYGTSTQGAVHFQPNIDFISIYQRNYTQANSLPGNIVACFYPGKDNSMWIGTSGYGICRFNPQTNQYINYNPTINANDQLPGKFVRSINASVNKIFFASEKGLTSFDERTGKFITYGQGIKNNSSPVPDGNIRRIYESSPGQLLLVSHRVATFNATTGECVYKEAGEKDTLYKLENITASSYNRAAGILWLVAGGEDLYEYRPATNTLLKREKTALHIKEPSTPMSVIDAGIDGTLWIARGKNILHYDPVSKTLLHNIAVNSTVFNISSERDQTWFTSKNEIGRIDKTNGSFVSFNVNTLLRNVSFREKSLTRDNNGLFWLGGNAGFCIIDPARFKSDAVVRMPDLTGFKVFDKARHFALPYNDIKEINLNYNDNFFSFTFSTFDFGDTRSAGYAYKLDPFDKEWKFSNETPASYTNVPPGNYRLLVRPANSDNASLQKELAIRIQPPFWKTNWFVLCLFILFSVLALWLWKIRKRSINKQKADATIDYFANSVYGENSANEICWDIARNCISQLQFEDCVVYLMDDDKNALVQKAAYGPKNPKGHDIVNPITILPGEGIVGTVLSTGKLLLVGDTSKDARYIVDDVRRYSELAVPILHNDKVIGVIDSENSKKNFYTAEHVKAMTTIASISGNKIAEAQAREYARENEIKLLEIKKMLAESQLMALRAQMNPHFVFNCLNSIQECIVTNKYREATTYLNKFSRLFRMVLNNSGKNLVTLGEERNVLELYLELEYMRFENKFSYVIYMDEELESDEILIPSMLLQPYVENALWHGLMHKEGDRVLMIRFEKICEDIFSCSIDDNGIGRQRSFELKERQSKTKRHESKGLGISSDRLDVLRRQGYHAQLQITDKYNSAGEPAGTNVNIELSTFLKN